MPKLLTGQKTGKAKDISHDVLRPKRFRCVNYGGHTLTLVTSWNGPSRRYYMAKLIIDGKEAIVDRDELIGYLRVE